MVSEARPHQIPSAYGSLTEDQVAVRAQAWPAPLQYSLPSLPKRWPPGLNLFRTPCRPCGLGRAPTGRHRPAPSRAGSSRTPEALPEGDRLHLKHMLTHLQGDRLPEWIAAASATAEWPSLRHFAQHLLRDLDAVTADLTLLWNSGVVEGHANRSCPADRPQSGVDARDHRGPQTGSPPEAGPRQPRAEQQRLALASTARTRHFRAPSLVELQPETGLDGPRPVSTTGGPPATVPSPARPPPRRPLVPGGPQQLEAFVEPVGSHRALRPVDPLLNLRHEWIDPGSCAARSPLLGPMPSEGSVHVRSMEHTSVEAA